MQFYAVKQGKNPGIYTNLFEVFNNLDINRKRRGYEVYKNENHARKYMGYPVMSDDADGGSLKGLIDYSFNEIKDNSIKKYKGNLKDNSCIAYVDGSYNFNKKVYGAGVVFITKDKIYTKKESYTDKYKKYTNVSGEVLAAIIAIDTAIDFGFTNITIYHDMSLPSLNNGGKRPKSKIMKMYLNYLESVRCLIQCKFKKVKAHSGNYYNEKADHLAGLSTGINRHVMKELEKSNKKSKKKMR